MNHYTKIGGILTIVSGSLAVLPVAMTLFSIFTLRAMLSQPLSTYPALPPEFLTMITVFYGVLALFFALSGTLGVVGGVCALKKKRWGLALAGSIAGTVTFMPVGIPAIIYVTMAKQEFSAPKPSEPIG
ncbi:hypothetical protein ACFLWI_04150 [Chloroflexota bacterium]